MELISFLVNRMYTTFLTWIWIQFEFELEFEQRITSMCVWVYCSQHTREQRKKCVWPNLVRRLEMRESHLATTPELSDLHDLSLLNRCINKNINWDIMALAWTEKNIILLLQYWSYLLTDNCWVQWLNTASKNLLCYRVARFELFPNSAHIQQFP